MNEAIHSPFWQVSIRSNECYKNLEITNLGRKAYFLSFLSTLKVILLRNAYI